METKYDIDDVIYIPAKVEKVTKMSNGRVFYRLRTVDGGYQIDTTEEKIDEEYMAVRDKYLFTSTFVDEIVRFLSCVGNEKECKV